MSLELEYEDAGLDYCPTGTDLMLRHILSLSLWSQPRTKASVESESIGINLIPQSVGAGLKPGSAETSLDLQGPT